MDHNGTAAVATVAHGAEVEILAWHPRRAADPRYRVRATKDGAEGWLEAASLEVRALPPAPKRSVPREPPAAAPKAAVAREVPVAPKRSAPRQLPPAPKRRAATGGKRR